MGQGSGTVGQQSSSNTCGVGSTTLESILASQMTVDCVAPTNYTASNSTLCAHLAGLDAALGLIIVAGNIYTANGTLLADRTMLGDTKSLTFGTAASRLQTFNVETLEDIELHASLFDSPNQWDVKFFTDIYQGIGVISGQRDSDLTQFSVSPDDVIIEASVANFKGATYAADYSADFVNESLITKRYGDALTNITDDRLPRGTGSAIEDGTWSNVGNDIYPETTGSNIGDATHRIGTIFMASKFDYASELQWESSSTIHMRLGASGNLTVGGGISGSARVRSVGDASIRPFVGIASTALTNSREEGLVIRHTTSDTPVDGFGVQIAFEIEHPGSGTEQCLGDVGFERDGTDDTGKFILRACEAGTAFEILTGEATGELFAPSLSIAEIDALGANSKGLVTKEWVEDKTKWSDTLGRDNRSSGNDVIMSILGTATSVPTQFGSDGIRLRASLWDTGGGGSQVTKDFVVEHIASTTVSLDSELCFGYDGANLVSIPNTGSIKFLTALTNDNGEDTVLAIDATGKVITRSAATINPDQNLSSVLTVGAGTGGTTIIADSTSNKTVISDSASTAKILFDDNGSDDIVITPNTDASSAFTFQVSTAQVYGSATDFSTVAGGYFTQTANTSTMSWYDPTGVDTDNKWVIDGQNSKVELNVKFSGKASRLGQEFAVLDNFGGDKVTDNNDSFPVALSTRNTTIKSGVTNSVALGVDGITVKTDDTAYVNQVGFWQSTGPDIEGLLQKATLTADRTWDLPDASGTIALLSDIPAADGDGIYDGAGTVPTATISTLTDYWRIDGGDVGINLLLVPDPVPKAKLHVRGDSDLDALRVDADIWTNSLVVQELSGSPFVSIFSNSKVANEIFRVSGGNTMLASNLTVGGSTAPGGFTSVSQRLNMPDGSFIGFGIAAGGATSNPIFGHSGTATIIDMIAAGTVDIRDNTDTIIAQFLNSGNFGVGSALTPLEKLHIDGNARVDGDVMIPLTDAYQIDGIDFLKSSQAIGGYNIMLGDGASGTDAGNGGFVAIGTNTASTESGIAIGNFASVAVGTFDGIAIGRSAAITAGARAIAIGRSASAGHNDSFAFGDNVTTSANNQYRYGVATTINAFDGTGVFGAATLDSVAQLEVTSTTKGFRITPMTAAEAAAITAVEGLQVFTSDTDGGSFPTIGLYSYENGGWVKL